MILATMPQGGSRSGRQTAAETNITAVAERKEAITRSGNNSHQLGEWIL
jgi:hypothetical protein